MLVHKGSEERPAVARLNFTVYFTEAGSAQIKQNGYTQRLGIPRINGIMRTLRLHVF